MLFRHHRPPLLHRTATYSMAIRRHQSEIKIRPTDLYHKRHRPIVPKKGGELSSLQARRCTQTDDSHLPLAASWHYHEHEDTRSHHHKSLQHQRCRLRKAEQCEVTDGTIIGIVPRGMLPRRLRCAIYGGIVDSTDMDRLHDEWQ